MMPMARRGECVRGASKNRARLPVMRELEQVGARRPRADHYLPVL